MIKNKLDKLYWTYVMTGFIFSIAIELVNHRDKQPTGLGIIFFCCIMILYYVGRGNNNG